MSPRRDLAAPAALLTLAPAEFFFTLFLELGSLFVGEPLAGVALRAGELGAGIKKPAALQVLNLIQPPGEALARHPRHERRHHVERLKQLRDFRGLHPG